MSVYENLEQFSLKIHGDSYERERAEAVLASFPLYETFWKRFIVPLTNRINPQIKQGEPEWIRFRSEIVLSNYEQMTMHHYSAFYFLARAHERIRAALAFPEDAFFLLDACAENVAHFFQDVKRILKDFGRPINFPVRTGFCKQADRTRPVELRGAFVEAQEYRNVLVHNPVLGRAVSEGRELLPRRSVLEKVKKSWRSGEQLSPEERVESGALFSQIWKGCGEFLQEEWVRIIAEFDSIRDTDRFKSQLHLQALLPILAPATIYTATSLGTNISASPSAVLPIIQNFGKRPE